MRLTIELVPKTCWYSNVRSEVTRKQWDIIRKTEYANAGHKCEICKDVGTNQGKRHKVECHEIWHYDDVTKIQELVGMIVLCPNCHTVKHPGLAAIQKRQHIVISQLMKINGMTRLEANQYVAEAFAEWEERSKHKWTLNIDHLKNYDI